MSRPSSAHWRPDRLRAAFAFGAVSCRARRRAASRRGSRGSLTRGTNGRTRRPDHRPDPQSPDVPAMYREKDRHELAGRQGLSRSDRQVGHRASGVQRVLSGVWRGWPGCLYRSRLAVFLPNGGPGEGSGSNPRIARPTTGVEVCAGSLDRAALVRDVPSYARLGAVREAIGRRPGPSVLRQCGKLVALGLRFVPRVALICNVTRAKSLKN